MRRAAALVLLPLALAIAIVALTRVSGHASDQAPATSPFGPRPRIFPKLDRLATLPYVSVAGRRKREVALTFDDGPGPQTAEVVRTLRRLRAPATFFQIGVDAHAYVQTEELQRKSRLVTIANHTLRHRRLDRLSRAEQAAEIDGETAILRAAGLPVPTLFRAPYGAFNATTLELLRERHMTMVLWTVDSQDYRRPGVEKIVANVLAGVRPGAIILLHDAGGDRSQTIAALPLIVKALRERHYRIVSVPRLLRDAPPPRKQPPRIIGAG